MRCRRQVLAVVAVAGFAVMFGGLLASPAWAHAGLRSSDPSAGSSFETAPTTVRLTFLEAPEPSLAVIRVTGPAGASVAGQPAKVPGDDLTLAVPVQLPGPGRYTVAWRVVSAVDGHRSTGTFTFGVGVDVAGAPLTIAEPSAELSVSPLELLGRFVFAAGLIGVLGAAVARLLRFGGQGPGSWLLARAGLAASVVGLSALAWAQRLAAQSSFSDLFGTSIGRALIRRAVAVAVVVVGLVLAAHRWRRGRRWPWWLVGAAASAAVAVHVAAGHAAARTSWRVPMIAAQWVHVMAVSVWAGGLAALLLAIRGAPAKDKAASVRRFSTLAAPALAVLFVTGVVRAVGGVSTWGDLVTTGYGRAVSVKVALVAAIAALAVVNRRRSVPAAATSLRLLRRLAGAELVLATGAVGVAALLASLPPPSALEGVEAPGLVVTGADAATTVRVQLRTASAFPGLNRFALRVTDYDSGKPVAADRVTLRFTPLDDPWAAPSELVLGPAANRSFEATGSNLSVDGRWGVTALVQQGSSSVSVPLELQTKGTPQFLSVQRIPGEPVKYTVELVSGGGFLRVWTEPQRPGDTKVYATFFDRFGDALPMGDPVLTAGAGRAVRQYALQRLDSNRFVADVDVPAGRTEIAVVARTVNDDQRLRGTVTVEVPRR